MGRALIALMVVARVARADDPPVIKPAAIVETVTAAFATADPAAAKGHGHVIAYIQKVPTSLDLDALRTSFANQGWKIVDEFATEALTAITVEGPNRARATISVGTERGEIGLTDRPAWARAPGPCVAIPKIVHEVIVTNTGIGGDGELLHGENRWKLATTRTFDVDGDGIVDAFVPVATSRSDCPDEVSWRVFVVRGGCGHALGVVGPGWLVPAAMTMAIDASGFRPLVFDSRHVRTGTDRVPEMVTTTSSFGIKHGAYQRISARETAGRCHHCSRSSCTAVAP